MIEGNNSMRPLYIIPILIGAISGFIIANGTYSNIDGFSRETADGYTESTTEGVAYCAAIMLGAVFLFCYAGKYAGKVYDRTLGAAEQPIASNNKSSDVTYAYHASAWGLLAGAFTGIYTAKYIGLTDPVRDSSGTKIDYDFTAAGDGYIAGLAFAGMILAPLFVTGVRKMLRMSQDGANNSSSLQNNNPHSKILNHDI